MYTCIYIYIYIYTYIHNIHEYMHIYYGAVANLNRTVNIVAKEFHISVQPLVNILLYV